jgi:hypothetical protein
MSEAIKSFLGDPQTKLPQTDHYPMSIRIILLVLLALVVFLLGTFQINDSDFWWHLATGRYIIETADIPDTDPFTFTSGGNPWIAHEWLFGFLIYQIHQWAGIPSLILLKAALLTVTFLLLFLLLYKRTQHYFISSLVVLFAAILAHQRFYVRAELATLFFSVLVLYLITSYKQHLLKALWILPFVFCLWANLHAGVLFGLYIIWAYTFTEALRIIFKSSLTPSVKQWSFLVLISLMSSLAAFVNPNTYRSLLYPFLVLHTERKVLMHNIEWQPPGFDPNFYLFWGVLGFLIIILLMTIKKVRLFDLLIVIPFSLLAIRSQRSIGLFALMTAPILGWHLKAAFDLISEKWNSIPMKRTFREGLLTILILIVIAGFSMKGFLLYDKPFVFGTGIRGGMPVGAAHFMEKHDLTGNMYNAHEFGGYLIWRFYPERKAFIDGRNYLHRELFGAMNITTEDPKRWEEFLSRYDIQFAVLSYPMKLPNRWDKFSSDAAGLFPSNDWGLAYWDDWAMVYLNRHHPKNREILEKLEYKMIRPSEMRLEYLDHLLEDPRFFQFIVEELRRKIGEDPDCYRAHNILGMVHSRMGHFQEAIERYNKAISLYPNLAQLHYNLAVCYLKNEQFAEAKKELLRTKRLEKNVAKTDWLLKELRSSGY